MAVQQMKKEASPDPVFENYKELKSVEKRLVEIEKGQEKLDAELNNKETTSANDFKDFSAAIEDNKKQIEEIRAELKAFIQEVMLFVKDLQQTAKTEDLERLQRTADYWTPESWATRNSIIKSTKRILDEQK